MMRNRLRRAGLLSKAVLFTLLIHGALLALLLFSFNYATPVKHGGAQPIQAVAVSEQAILAQVEKDRREEEAKKKEAERAAKHLEELTRKQREEEQKLAALEDKRKAEEEKQRQLAEEQKRKAAEEKKQAEAEAKRIAEAKKKAEAEAKRQAEAEAEKKRQAEAEKEKKRKEAEAKKQAEAEKKRKAAEEKKKREAEAKRKAEEEKKKREAEQRRRAEEQLRRELEQEQRLQTQGEAADALNALIGAIRHAVESVWRRPQIGASGLTATVRVRVARDGRVSSVRVVKGSGDRLFDESVELAVRKASPLPFPTKREYYEFINEFQFIFRDPNAF